MSMALTPAHFALGEIRFKKQFRKLPADALNLLPVEEYVELNETQRQGKTPFVHRSTASSV